MLCKYYIVEVINKGLIGTIELLNHYHKCSSREPSCKGQCIYRYVKRIDFILRNYYLYGLITSRDLVLMLDG